MISKAHIQFKKIWSDEDAIELCVEVCNGTSLFSNKVYIEINGIEELVKDLKIFRSQIRGGIYDINFGSFGPEYASGAFEARLHFHEAGKGMLYISTRQQSGFEIFKENKVASEARMYLKAEPALLDQFIAELGDVNLGHRSDARIQCLQISE